MDEASTYILGNIVTKPDITTGELLNLFGNYLPRATFFRKLKELRKLGYIKRRVNDKDETVWFLTSEGLKNLQKVVKEANKREYTTKIDSLKSLLVPEKEFVSSDDIKTEEEKEVIAVLFKALADNQKLIKELRIKVNQQELKKFIEDVEKERQVMRTKRRFVRKKRLLNQSSTPQS
ncbi:MAG TPA: helix-turn-helix domain-containing protein [Candidatus Nanoarchaeia archaeon]|nr:helix-turn-helix domain-containing protein [Candidatus Nanoarchaeia archaeon]